MTTTERILSGPRASSLVMCERRAVYEAIGAKRDETDPAQERIFRRGRRIGQMLAEEIAETLAADGREAVLEREIPWPYNNPIGVGHADLFIPDERHMVEIVSTKDADLPHYKPRQVAFYVLNDPDAEHATVLSIDPSTNEERSYSIDVEAFRADLTESVMRAIRAINAGRPADAKRALRHDGDQVDSPSGFPCFGCPFRRPCWDGWEPDPVGELPAELHAIVERLAAVEDELGRYKAAPSLEEERAELRERLRGRMKPGTNYRAPGFDKIRFTEVSGRRTFSLKDFEAAGHRMPDVAEDFTKTGAGHDRWTITREQGS